ncbi:hypothetical protein [Streptomyces sp. NPDC054863]
MKFNHHFGEGRKVAFRLCVQENLAVDDCTDDDDGQWEIGYAREQFLHVQGLALDGSSTSTGPKRALTVNPMA